MLRLDRLKVGYHKATHTNALNVSFEQGELVVLLGRNGCGKTTLLRTLAGFQKPVEGAVEINQQLLKTLSIENLAQQLSIVTTERLETPYMRVYDLIALGRYPYLGFMGKLQDSDHTFIDTILTTLKIEHLSNKYLTQCSDGERQMVLLARALAQDTPVILLDEATAHLDFVNRVKIFQTLSSLVANQKKLIFFATHELEIALKYADKVLLYQDGQIFINTPQYFIENGQLQAVFDVEGLDYQLNL